MTAISDRPTGVGVAAPKRTLGQHLVTIITTTDHKLIGKLYLATAFTWFLIGGVMALIMRSELAFPGQQIVNDEVYNPVHDARHDHAAALRDAAVLRLRQRADAAADRRP